jgi:hypothetical protein
MFSILKWLFWAALLFTIFYVGYVFYKSFDSGATTSNLNNNISKFFSQFNVETPKNIVSTSTFVDFFSPRYIAPLTVVPGPGWYENMDALYKQIYMNNMNSVQANTYFDSLYQNNLLNNNLNNSQIKSEHKSQDSGLYLLFPSSWMENLRH